MTLSQFIARPDEGWAHEDQSFAMFESLIQENNLWPEFEREGFTKIDMLFIKELIHPPKSTGDVYPFRGRGPSEYEGASMTRWFSLTCSIVFNEI